MNAAKSQVESLLQRLPYDCTLEDIQYRLHVIEKVRRSLDAATFKAYSLKTKLRGGWTSGLRGSLVVGGNRAGS